MRNLRKSDAIAIAADWQARDPDHIYHATQSKTVNPMSKTRPVSNPYEVWQLDNWTWAVLKAYQAPDKEATNPYGRRFCAVASPHTFGGYDMGDVYFHPVHGPADHRAICVYRDPALDAIDVAAKFLPHVQPSRISLDDSTDALCLTATLRQVYQYSRGIERRLADIFRQVSLDARGEGYHLSVVWLSDTSSPGLVVKVNTAPLDPVDLPDNGHDVKDYLVRNPDQFVRRYNSQDYNQMTGAGRLAWLDECLAPWCYPD